jgi:uncharacterized membrane protein
MAQQEASTIVPVPLATVEARLRQVERWPEFLIGLQHAAKTGPDRYRFTLNDGARPREVDVAVVRHARDHRTLWRSLSGPSCRGEWRLTPVDAAHTRVQLTLAVDPAGFFQGLAEMLGTSKDTAACDLQQLEAFLTAEPAGSAGTG